MSGGCSFCGMEAFTNAPLQEPTQEEQFFQAQKPATEKYTCEQGKGQRCLYTAQGVVTCMKDSSVTSTYTQGR